MTAAFPGVPREHVVYDLSRSRSVERTVERLLATGGHLPAVRPPPFPLPPFPAGLLPLPPHPLPFAPCARGRGGGVSLASPLPLARLARCSPASDDVDVLLEKADPNPPSPSLLLLLLRLGPFAGHSPAPARALPSAAPAAATRRRRRRRQHHHHPPDRFRLPLERSRPASFDPHLRRRRRVVRSQTDAHRPLRAGRPPGVSALLLLARRRRRRREQRQLVQPAAARPPSPSPSPEHEQHEPRPAKKPKPRSRLRRRRRRPRPRPRRQMGVDRRPPRGEPPAAQGGDGARGSTVRSTPHPHPFTFPSPPFPSPPLPSPFGLPLRPSRPPAQESQGPHRTGPVSPPPSSGLAPSLLAEREEDDDDRPTDRPTDGWTDDRRELVSDSPLLPPSP